MPILSQICVSAEKGKKYPVDTGEFVADFGLAGDFHAGSARQVSLLRQEDIAAFADEFPQVKSGDFGENLIIGGAGDLRVGSRLIFREAVLEITQLGKECHTACAIRQTLGDCIMPKLGLFAKVVKGGTLHVGDAFTVPHNAAVITLSDRCFRGESVDTAGPAACEILRGSGVFAVTETLLLPDDARELTQNLIRIADETAAPLIVTCGGTGFSKRDITPEATIAAGERQVPGIAEEIRRISREHTDRAILSRGVCVIRNGTVIVNLPGSERAVRQTLAPILAPLAHGIDILKGVSE